MTKQIGEFLASKILKDLLDIHETPPALERSFEAAIKLKSELPTDTELETEPLMEISSLPEHIHVKT